MSASFIYRRLMHLAELFLGSSAQSTTPERTGREIADKYFADRPEAKDEVIKAYYAYHAGHVRENVSNHNFAGPWRDCECSWCGRSRELVRWDDLPAQCQRRPVLPDIADVIRCEEVKAFALLDKANGDVPRLVAKLGMGGETLAILHHTYGYDPETVDGIVPVPPDIMAGYHAARESEQDRSRAAIVRRVVAARTTDADPVDTDADPIDTNHNQNQTI